jgi:hypothetical protein
VGEGEDRDLRARSDAEDHKRSGDRLDARTRAQDRAIYEAMGMAVLMVVIMIGMVKLVVFLFVFADDGAVGCPEMAHGGNGTETCWSYARHAAAAL